MSSDDEWEIVTNHEREKREARKERRQKEEVVEAARLQQEADEYAKELNIAPRAPTRNAPSSRSAAAEVPRAVSQTLSARRAARNAKKGKSKSSNKSVKLPQSEPDLVEFIKKLLVLESKKMTTAELGARVQAATRTSWNKAFKSEYGAMDKFLKTHSQVFNVAKESGEIFVSLQTGKSKKKKTSSPQPSAESSSSSSRSPKKPSAKSTTSKSKGDKKPAKLVDDAEQSGSDDASESPKPPKKQKRKKKNGAVHPKDYVASTGETLFTFVFVTAFLSWVTYLYMGGNWPFYLFMDE